MGNMLGFIANRDGKWWVPNPAHEEENFADKWNEYPERREAFYFWYDQIATSVNDLAGVEAEGLDAVFARLTRSFDHDPILRSYERYAARMGAVTEHRMDATGRLSLSAAGRGTREHTFDGRHSRARD